MKTKNTKEPKYVAETLKWCNALRKEQGKKALLKMPKGYMGDPKTCPCGNAAKLAVSLTTWGFQDEHKRDRRLPMCVQRFVATFDAGELPQYIAGELPKYIA